jgi:hypothetical protein
MSASRSRAAGCSPAFTPWSSPPPTATQASCSAPPAGAPELGQALDRLLAVDEPEVPWRDPLPHAVIGVAATLWPTRARESSGAERPRVSTSISNDQPPTGGRPAALRAARGWRHGAAATRPPRARDPRVRDLAGPARTTRPGQRGLRWRGHVRRPDREVARRGGDRRVQHQKRGPGPLTRRRPRRRLHPGGLHPQRPALRLIDRSYPLRQASEAIRYLDVEHRAPRSSSPYEAPPLGARFRPGRDGAWAHSAAKKAAISPARRCGSSAGAKWPPLGIEVHRRTLYSRSAHCRGGSPSGTKWLVNTATAVGT